MVGVSGADEHDHSLPQFAKTLCFGPKFCTLFYDQYLGVMILSVDLENKAKSCPIDASRVVQELSTSCPEVSRGVQRCPELSRVAHSRSELPRVTQSCENKNGGQTDRPTDGRTDGRTHSLIEMRGASKNKRQKRHLDVCI